MDVLFFILKIVALSIISFAAFWVLKRYVLSKFKVNKWIIIGITIAVAVIPMILSSVMNFQLNSIVIQIQSGIMVVLFLCILDSTGWNINKALGQKTVAEKNNIRNYKSKYPTTAVIKSKAKPNRLKNSNMEVIDIRDIKKRKKK